MASKFSAATRAPEGVGFHELGFLTNVNMLEFVTRLDFVFPTPHNNIAVDSNPTIGGVVSAKATRPGPFSQHASFRYLLAGIIALAAREVLFGAAASLRLL